MKIAITGGSGFIGTNCVSEALRRNWSVINLDIEPPVDASHMPYWKNVDIRDENLVNDTIKEFEPDFILHLAAIAGMEFKDISELSTNTDGTQNVIEAAKGLSSFKRIIVTSSLLVCKNGYIPENDTDYCPPNVYGESKVITEQLARAEDASSCPWVIVRPTSVWGPWFKGGYMKFFDVIKKGTYFHQGNRKVVKAQTYVGNSVYMMFAMLLEPSDKVVGQTFYLADWPQHSIREWADTIAIEYEVKNIPTIPLFAMRILGYCGDLIKFITRKDPPITSFRLNNMLVEADYPWKRTADVIGTLPNSLQDGVKHTISWMKSKESRS